VHLREPRFLSKQPANTFRVHVLREIFPDCRLVAIHRDGRDVVASWGRNDRWQPLGGYGPAIDLMARKWNECIDHIEAWKDALGILTLRYEDLVSDLPGALRRVLAHCDLPWPAGVYDDIAAQDRTGRWLELIPAEHHDRVEAATARNRLRLGYGADRFTLPRPWHAPAGDTMTPEQTFHAAPRCMVRCAGCGGEDFVTLTTADRHGLGLCTAMCTACGLVQTNPRPPADWYAHFYRRAFWPLYVGGRAESAAQRYVSDGQDRKGRLVGDVLLAACPGGHRRYLDIGCGLGGLAGYLKSRRPDWHIAALDPAPEIAVFVAGRFGIPVTCAPLETLPVTGRYDLISIVHVLEHTLDPVAVLRRVSELLADDGLLYIEVPDLWSARWQGAGFFHVAHAITFDRLTLARVVQRAGLHVQRFIPSPVQRDWPWAVGAFVARRPATDSAPVPALADADELTRRRDWIALRLAPPQARSPGAWERFAQPVVRRLPGPVRNALHCLRSKLARG
jgi:SAM-dependent methyltransferase